MRRRPALMVGADELDALYELDLQPEVRDTYFALRRYRNRKTGIAWPSYTSLADALGVSERAMTDRIRAAERAGVIVCARRNGTATRYTFPLATPEADFSGKDGATPEGERIRPLKASAQNPRSPLQPNKVLRNISTQQPGDEGESIDVKEQDPARKKEIDQLIEITGPGLNRDDAASLIAELGFDEIRRRARGAVTAFNDDKLGPVIHSWPALLRRVSVPPEPTYDLGTVW